MSGQCTESQPIYSWRKWKRTNSLVPVTRLLPGWMLHVITHNLVSFLQPSCQVGIIQIIDVEKLRPGDICHQINMCTWNSLFSQNIYSLPITWPNHTWPSRINLRMLKKHSSWFSCVHFLRKGIDSFCSGPFFSRMFVQQKALGHKDRISLWEKTDLFSDQEGRDNVFLQD